MFFCVLIAINFLCKLASLLATVKGYDGEGMLSEEWKCVRDGGR